MGSGHTSLLARGCVRQPGSSVQTPRLEDFNGSFISWARSVTLTHLPGPLLSPEDGVGLKVPRCDHGLVFLVTSPVQEPTQSCPIRT